MNREYITQIENPNMKRRLLNVDNIPILEALLDREAQRLERLQKRKEDNKLNLGNKVSPDELKELFPQICTEVGILITLQLPSAFLLFPQTF